MQQSVLSANHVVKSYAGVAVLLDVSLDLSAGEVLGLVGENGAGKSTLLNILSGVTQPDSGQILIKGTPVVLHGYHQANRLGVFRVFQEGALIPNLTVYENLLLSHERQFNRLGVYLDRRAMKKAALRILTQAGLSIDVNRRVDELSLSHRQALEIARATALSTLLGIEHPVILLDEPTTALDAQEEQATIRLIKRLKGEASFILVSHRFQEIFEVSDRILVLKDGKTVDTLQVSDADDALLHRLMVGRERVVDETVDPLIVPDAGKTSLTVRHLSVDGALRDVSLDLRPCEILGIGGLEGSGKSMLARVLGGAARPNEGTIELDGQVVPVSLRRMMDRGVVYMPGDRQDDGLILGASIAHNVVLPSLHDRFSNALGILRLRRARRVVRHWMEQLGLSARSPRTPVETLSGGQQQKVLFAKYLSREPRLLIMENPTRGVDVHTKTELYRLIRALAGGGAGVVLVSDDLPELIGLSDRIAILSHGRVVDTVESSCRGKPTEEELVRLMLSTAPNPSGDTHRSRPSVGSIRGDAAVKAVTRDRGEVEDTATEEE